MTQNNVSIRVRKTWDRLSNLLRANSVEMHEAAPTTTDVIELMRSPINKHGLHIRQKLISHQLDDSTICYMVFAVHLADQELITFCFGAGFKNEARGSSPPLTQCVPENDTNTEDDEESSGWKVEAAVTLETTLHLLGTLPYDQRDWIRERNSIQPKRTTSQLVANLVASASGKNVPFPSGRKEIENKLDPNHPEIWRIIEELITIQFQSGIL